MTAPFTKAEIEALEALAKAATGLGTWSGPGRCDGAIRATHEGERVSIAEIYGKDDYAYIAAACNAVPRLIGHIRTLQSRFDFLDGEHTEALQQADQADADRDAALLRADAAEEAFRLSRAREAAMADALKPFAEYAGAADPGDWASESSEFGEVFFEGLRYSIRLRDLRVAARVLADRDTAETGGEGA